MEQVILNETQIENKCLRIAYQIIESNIEDHEIFLIGIDGNGFLLAKKLQNILHEISEKRVKIGKISLDKRNPLKGATCTINKEEIQNKALILVDDVLQTGTTLMYGVKFFLDIPLKRFKTAVLVDRNHKKYPIKADFKGLSLSTSNQSKVEVRFKENEAQAILIQ